VPIDILCGQEEGKRPIYSVDVSADGIIHGDRACFAADPDIGQDGMIASPFLDNRLGCWLLCELAKSLPLKESVWHVVLGATACEEIGGFGAPVLATEVRPDLVICLDATYEDEEQNVLVGNGPVLTLSDASVIISPDERDAFLEFFAREKIPLQTEVYNYSGTDSRAFPHAGLATPVYALLLPTRGNHTPREEGSVKDAENLLHGLEALVSVPAGTFPGRTASRG